MDLQQGYEEQVKELNEFTKSVMDKFREQGIQVDINSYKEHCYKVFILGKLHRIEEAIFGSKKKAPKKNITEEDKNVKETKTVKPKGRKKPTGKRRGASIQ